MLQGPGPRLLDKEPCDIYWRQNKTHYLFQFLKDVSRKKFDGDANANNMLARRFQNSFLPQL